MFKRKMAALCLSIATGSMLIGSPALAQDSELKFVSNIAAVAEDGSTITISVRGIDVIVDITADTEFKVEGDAIDLGGLSEGDSIEIEAYFAEGGRIVADEISILDRGQEEFRFRGLVNEVDFAATAPGSTDEVVRIALLGTDVYVNENAKIIIRGLGRVGRGRSDERSFSDLRMHLGAGDNVDLRGSYDGSALWASDLKIGERDDGEIEVEGTVVELTDDGFVVNIKDAGDFVIRVDDDTESSADLAVGDPVKVEGILTEDAAILAFEINDEGARDEAKSNGKGNGNDKGKGKNKGGDRDDDADDTADEDDSADGDDDADGGDTVDDTAGDDTTGDETTGDDNSDVIG